MYFLLYTSEKQESSSTPPKKNPSCGSFVRLSSLHSSPSSLHWANTESVLCPYSFTLAEYHVHETIQYVAFSV